MRAHRRMHTVMKVFTEGGNKRERAFGRKRQHQSEREPVHRRTEHSPEGRTTCRTAKTAPHAALLVRRRRRAPSRMRSKENMTAHPCLLSLALSNG